MNKHQVEPIHNLRVVTHMDLEDQEVPIEQEMAYENLEVMGHNIV